MATSASLTKAGMLERSLPCGNRYFQMKSTTGDKYAQIASIPLPPTNDAGVGLGTFSPRGQDGQVPYGAVAQAAVALALRRARAAQDVAQRKVTFVARVLEHPVAVV